MTGSHSPWLIAIVALIAAAAINPPARAQDSVILHDDFTSYEAGSDGSPRWIPVKGLWQMADGTYRQRSTEYDCATFLRERIDYSYRLEAVFEHVSGEPGAGFIFSSYTQETIDYAAMIRMDGPSTMIAGIFQHGEFTPISSTGVDSITTGSLHSLILEVRRDVDTLMVRLDGKTIFPGLKLPCPSGYLGLQSSGGVVTFHKVTLTRCSPSPSKAGPEWIRSFTIMSDGTIIVPRGDLGVVHLYSPDGRFLRSIGRRASEGGQLYQPTAAALLDDSTLILADHSAHRIHRFGLDGRWQASTGWKGTDRGTFDGPIAVSVDRHRRIFVLETHNGRVQVFDDSLRPIAEFGKGKLRNPLGLAIEDDAVYILNTGLSQIERFRWNGSSGIHTGVIRYGGGEGRGIAAAQGKVYLSLVNEVRRYDTSGTQEAVLRGRSIGFLVPWGIVVRKDGRVMIADFPGSRFILTDEHLLDPEPVITYPSREEALITWRSTESGRELVTIYEGNKVILDQQEKEHGVAHRAIVRNLPQAATLRVAVSPTLTTIPGGAGEQRPIPFRLPAADGLTQFARQPVAVLLFTTIVDDATRGRKPAPIPPVNQSGIDHIIKEIEDGIRFYWIHSGMRFFIDADFIVVTDPLTRSEVYGDQWWYPPHENILDRYLNRNGRHLTDYTGILYLTCTQSYDSSRGTFMLAGRGGGFTNGVGTGKGYGISWWDVTRENHNAGNNWLMVHEFNHQIDDIFLASGYPEYWFNHISPTIGTAARFGEHFDANAYILRIVPPDQWYDLRYTSIMTSQDGDGDGIPDNDPRLPLDERRLGSSPEQRDTDGDGLSDLEELHSSNWIIHGWGETYGGAALMPDLTSPDTDGDGIRDREDQLPCSPLPASLSRMAPRMDGVIMEDEWPLLGKLTDARINADIYGGWDDSTFYIGMVMDRDVPVKIMIDGSADGWFTGRENVQMILTPVSDSVVSIKPQVFNGSDPEQWPFTDASMATRVRVSSHKSRRGETYHLEIAIRMDPDLGMTLKSGAGLGYLIGFHATVDDAGSKRYVTLFEPNRFLYVKLQ